MGLEVWSLRSCRQHPAQLGIAGELELLAMFPWTKKHHMLQLRSSLSCSCFAKISGNLKKPVAETPSFCSPDINRITLWCSLPTWLASKRDDKGHFRDVGRQGVAWSFLNGHEVDCPVYSMDWLKAKTAGKHLMGHKIHYNGYYLGLNLPVSPIKPLWNPYETPIKPPLNPHKKSHEPSRWWSTAWVLLQQGWDLHAPSHVHQGGGQLFPIEAQRLGETSAFFPKGAMFRSHVSCTMLCMYIHIYTHTHIYTYIYMLPKGTADDAKI